jgi:hypothetical protein
MSIRQLVKVKKTKPIYSFRVLRAAYCVHEFEKTKPIFQCENERKSFYIKGYENFR